MATFVVAHGAWSAGFVWKKMHPLMRAAGHELRSPTYTGVGDRVHLAHKNIDLDMHIEDICAYLFHEDLSDVILIGHSYGGFVATGVADRMPERLREIVYLDAFAPRDGETMLDLATDAQRTRWQDGAATDGAGWRVPPNPPPPDTSAEDIAWITPRRHPQPINTMSQPLRLKRGETKLPRTYIYCTKVGPGDMFGPFAKRARSDAAWRYIEIDASHSPHITAPDALRDILVKIAADGGTRTPSNAAP
ncbi:MAG: alpha/beta fold hydrolase [Hyphomicrobium sp.]